MKACIIIFMVFMILAITFSVSELLLTSDTAQNIALYMLEK